MMISLQYYLNLFPLHAVSLNINSLNLAFLIVGLLINLLLPRVSRNKKAISRFFSGFFHALQTREYSISKPPITVEEDLEKKAATADAVNQRLCGGDLEIVLGRLGMGMVSGGAAETRMSSEEIVKMLEEKNPSLGEVKEAFDVFDANGDGFLDSKELQRVLCALGFVEGLSLEKCRRMIHAVDEDGDGRLDFHEFVKFMESPPN